MFGFFRKKKEDSPPVSRVIPRGDVSSFVPPAMTHVQQYSESDIKLIESLRGELTRSGVISTEILGTDKTGIDSTASEQSIDNIVSIVEEANNGALYEKDFNNEFYDPDIERQMDEQQLTSAGDINPLLDGLDDYGNQVYDRFAGDSPVSAPEDTEVGSDVSTEMKNREENDGHFVTTDGRMAINLPDGSVVFGEIVVQE